MGRGRVLAGTRRVLECTTWRCRVTGLEERRDEVKMLSNTVTRLLQQIHFYINMFVKKKWKKV